MLHAALAFLPFAAMLAVSPGPATAMVIQSAARGGRAYAVRATLGDAAGLALWAVASMLGVSALVVASHAAYTALKVVGAIVLIAYGVAAIRRARRHEPAPDRPGHAEPPAAPDRPAAPNRARRPPAPNRAPTAARSAWAS